MSDRMCDSGSSPLACVEFSVHCWFCGADRIGMSWRAAPMAPIPPTLSLAGRPMHGLLSEPWTRESCGLMSPLVTELPNAWLAPLPLKEFVPPSSATAWGAAVAARPAMEAATAAVAHSFFMFDPFRKADSVAELRSDQPGVRPTVA